MLKKTIGFILSFFLCLSISGIQLNAQENVIRISTADELVKFADEVNQGNYSGNADIIVNLETDIDLNGMEWTPIGIDEDHYFSGTFNGNGHTISNFKITVGSYQYTGFFGISDCDIMNLNLSGIISSDSFLNGSGADMAGSFAGYLIGGNISNCTSYVDFTFSGVQGYVIGGIAGAIENGSITYSFFDGSYYNDGISNSVHAGGICGIGANVEIINCANMADFYGLDYFGGIIGQAQGTTVIKNCFNTGTIDVGENGPFHGSCYFGGIVGTVYSSPNLIGKLTIESCYHAGEIIGRTQNDQIGALIGGVNMSTSYQNTITAYNNYYMTGDFNTIANSQRNPLNVVYINSDGESITSDEIGRSMALEDMESLAFLKEINQNGGNYVFNEDGTPLITEKTFDITVNTSPEDAQVSFISEDNTKYSVENHQVSLQVGQYTVLIEKENYHSIREQVTITYDISTHTLNYELVLLDADYRKVEDAVAKANDLDSELYKDFSGVEKAIAGVVYDLDITHQEEVNAMAKAIEDAINALEYKDADYTAVNDAIAKAEALNPEDYVDFTHVSDAIDAVVKNLDITHQKEVDDMAQAILDAISELEEKPAETEPSTPTETPSTSDNSYITCWMMIMIGAAMSLIGFVVYDYKKKLTH